MIYAQVLSRTNKGDAAVFKEVLEHIDARRGADRGQLMGLNELFEKVGATHDQRLRVVFTLVTYTNGPWSVLDGQEPRRILETASAYAPCTRPLVETRLRFLASADEYRVVEALIAGVLKTPNGYTTAKDIAEELKATSTALKDVPVPERRERLIVCFDEARAHSIACIEAALDEACTVAPMAALIRQTELRERLATTLSAVEVAWAKRRDAPVFFPQGELERRPAEVAFAALERTADELLERLYEIYCVSVSGQRAATHGRERRLELVDALRELDQGGSVVEAATRCAERIDAEVVRDVASLFLQAAAAERANNSDALSRLLDTLDARVDASLGKVAADERRLCDQLEAPLKAEAERRAAAVAERREAAEAERRRLAVRPPDAGRAPTAASSDYWGVSWNTSEGRWRAYYTDADGERHTCGTSYATQERAAVARLRRIRREGVEDQNRLNPIVHMWFAPRVHTRRREEPAAAAPAPAPTRASGRKRTPRVTSDLGAGSMRSEKRKKRSKD